MGKQVPITTSTPVTINIMLDWSQIDDGSLIQVEKNEKALKRILAKITRARSTLDWSQLVCFSATEVFSAPLKSF